MTSEPSSNGTNGRDESGRFVEGNVGGPGNPHAKQVARLRTGMLQAVSEDDLRAICAKLVEQAKAGSIPAAKEVLDRCLGRSVGLGDLTAWMDEIERSARRAAEDAEAKESWKTEVIAARLSEGSGIEREAILAFVNRRTDKPEKELTQLAVRLADASGVKYDELVDFLNGQIENSRAGYDVQEARGGCDVPPP